MEDVSEAIDNPEESFLDGELETLKSIYINEIEITENEKSTSVSIDLHPATADNIEQQYVRMTLKFILSEEYPEILPDINIKNPRGLSDEKLKSVLEDLLSIAQEKKGNSMLFEIIEAAKEHLTSQNRPSGECAICLYGFSDSDIFTRTECYHYYHSHCLARYAKNAQSSEKTDDKSEVVSSELLCPMCRIPIQFSAFEEQYPPPNARSDECFYPNEDVLELQKKMADLYQKQLEKGGIIDVEAEKNKYLLEISNVPTRSSFNDKPNAKAVESVSQEETLKDNAFVSPQKISKNKSSKFGSKQNYHESDYGRKKFDSRYEKNYDRYKRKNYDKYQNNKFQPSDDISSNYEGSKESCSTKNNSTVLDESRENKTSIDPESKNSYNSTKPKFSNYSSGRGGYYGQKNPRYNQSGRYNRYDYSNNGSNYSYNRDKRYNSSSNYNKSNFRDKNSSESNFHKNESSKDLDERQNVSQRSDANYDDRHESSQNKSKFKNDRTDKSYSHNSRESYSKRSDNVKDLNMRRYANQRKAHHIGKNMHSNTNGENCMQEETDIPETDNAEGDKVYPGRSKNSSNYSRHYRDNYQNDSYDYKRHNQFQKNSQSYNHYNQQSQRNRDSKDQYGSNSRNREYKDKVQTEINDKLPELEVKENESAIKENLQQDSIESIQNLENDVSEKCSVSETIPTSSSTILRPPPGFANPSNRVFYGLQAANPPPGFRKS